MFQWQAQGPTISTRVGLILMSGAQAPLKMTSLPEEW